MKQEIKEKIASVSKDILIAIGILGFIPIAVVAGNAVQLLKYTGLTKRPKIKTYEMDT